MEEMVSLTTRQLEVEKVHVIVVLTFQKLPIHNLQIMILLYTELNIVVQLLWQTEQILNYGKLISLKSKDKMLVAGTLRKL